MGGGGGSWSLSISLSYEQRKRWPERLGYVSKVTQQVGVKLSGSRSVLMTTCCTVSSYLIIVTIFKLSLKYLKMRKQDQRGKVTWLSLHSCKWRKWNSVQCILKCPPKFMLIRKHRIGPYLEIGIISWDEAIGNGVGPNPMAGVPKWKENRDTHTEREQ